VGEAEREAAPAPPGTEEDLRAQLERARTELRELNRIGMALMSERDPDRLLGLILTQARSLSASDAGSLYLVEPDAAGRERLHFLRSQNDTLPDLPSPDFTLPLDETSVAGFVALRREPVVLDDVYEIPGDLPFAFNRAAFDAKYGYRAKSMLVVPMTDHRDRMVGVLQLINRKSDPAAAIRTEGDADRWVLPYTAHDVSLVQSLAGQAAVSIENGRLYRDIENLFAGFIKAAVTAIDQRDPTTSGHSVRVTELACDTAALVDAQTEGPFGDVHFTAERMRQLRYACLLHDFGKVGVREEVLVKTNKLPPVMGARIEVRFGLIRRTLEAEAARAREEVLMRHGPESPELLAAVDQRLSAELDALEHYRAAIEDANIPRIFPEEPPPILREMHTKLYTAPDGTERPYLTEEELHFLSIPRGNLDEEERRQIESHVIHGYDFLLAIPWTEELSRIHQIVRGHHEKLNGGGYPDGVSGEAVPLETRIMTVCDIFDALTASDRPYKRALPVDQALDILRSEAREGALDAEIVDLFCRSGVYRKVLESDWRRF
jgi:HD-GYP domain-containing protein (c-di-GMP phosphodiesterase class II)